MRKFRTAALGATTARAARRCVFVGWEQPITCGGQRAARNAAPQANRRPSPASRSGAVPARSTTSSCSAGRPSARSARSASWPEGHVRPRVQGVRAARRRRPADCRRRSRPAVRSTSACCSPRTRPIATNDFVLLEDDKQLQLADNLVPVLQKDVAGREPNVATCSTRSWRKLTQEELTDLNKAVTVDGKTSAEGRASRSGSPPTGFDCHSAGLTGKGNVTVGSTNFYEQEILGEIFAQILEATAAPWSASSSSATARSSSRPSRRATSTSSPSTRPPPSSSSTRAQARRPTIGGRDRRQLNERSTPLGLAALDYAAATDQNGFVVTKATADKYGSPRSATSPSRPRPVGLTGSDHTCPRQSAGGS